MLLRVVVACGALSGFLGSDVETAADEGLRARTPQRADDRGEILELISKQTQDGLGGCADSLMAHVSASLSGGHDLAGNLNQNMGSSDNCRTGKASAAVYVNDETAKKVANLLLARAAKVSETQAEFQSALSAAAKMVDQYLPARTKAAARLLDGVMGQRDYRSYCHVRKSQSVLIVFRSNDATSPHNRELNFLLTLYRFITHVQHCPLEGQEVKPGSLPARLTPLSLREYKDKFESNTDAQHPGLVDSVDEGWKDATERAVVHGPTESSAVLREAALKRVLARSLAAGGAVSRMAKGAREKIAAHKLAAEKSPPIPEHATIVHDEVEELAALEAQTSRLKRVGNNVAKTWDYMRDAGIDALSAVVTVDLLADYADLVQQICYHLEKVDASSANVAGMIEATLVQINDKVVGSPPILAEPAPSVLVEPL